MKRISISILAGIAVIFGIIPDCAGAVCVGGLSLAAEMPTIRQAAQRNFCCGDDFLILLAIRKAENGRAGCEFGIMHPKAWSTDLDTQAGWAAATIIKNRKRWIDSGRCCYDFIEFLGRRYCPVETDPQGHINWVKNVRYFYTKYKEAEKKKYAKGQG